MSKQQGLSFNRSLIGPLELSEMSGGLCSAYPAHSIDNNQVVDCLNALFEKRGVSKWPGMIGLLAGGNGGSPTYGYPVDGFYSLRLLDGSDLFIVFIFGQVWQINSETGQIVSYLRSSSVNNVVGSWKVFAINYYNKLWTIDRSQLNKIESVPTVSMYPIGIAPPDEPIIYNPIAFSTSISGSLAAGEYKIYVSYARMINGVTVLYSAPHYVGSLITNGSQGITISGGSSPDLQVTDVVAWMTDANGATFYYYGQIQDLNHGKFNTWTINIPNSSNKNTSLLMYEQAAGNQAPYGIVGLYGFDGRLWGWKDNSNILYYSMKAQNVFDLERWPTENNIPTIPYSIISVHGIGSDLYVNTFGGMYRIQNADISSKPQPVTQGATSNSRMFYFPKNNTGTIVEYNNALIGLTNDGVRVFDGTRFSIDVSKHIKPTIDIIKQNALKYSPAAFIYRRSGKRTEYQLSYNDLNYSSANRNRRLILNLDRLAITDENNYSAPWEVAQIGFSHAVTTLAGNVIYADSTESGGCLFSESGDGQYKWVFGDNGAFIATDHEVPVHFYIKTKTRINELAGLDVWQRIYSFSKLKYPCSARIVISDAINTSYSFALAASSVGKLLTIDADRLSHSGVVYSCKATYVSGFMGGDDEPGVGGNWAAFWAVVSSPPVGVTYPSWVTGTTYYGVRQVPINNNLNQTVPVLDGTPPLTFPFTLPTDAPLSEFNKLPPSIKGNSMFLELDQKLNDPDFFIYEIQCYGIHERNTFS